MEEYADPSWDLTGRMRQVLRSFKGTERRWTYQKEKKSLTSFSPVDEEMFLTKTVLADMLLDVCLFVDEVVVKVRNTGSDYGCRELWVWEMMWFCGWRVYGMFVLTTLSLQGKHRPNEGQWRLHFAL
jgi:hypothetical protein